MSKITKVTIHITASNPNATVEDIRRMHKTQGWSDIGYHWLVDRQGIVYSGRPESITGAHVAGHNSGNIGISYISRGSDTEPYAPYGKFMTTAQARALEEKVADILLRYKLTVNDIYGHNDFNKGKACPCFNVRKSTEFLNNVQRCLNEIKGGAAGNKNDAVPEQAEAVDGVDAEVTEAPEAATKE